MHWGDFPVNDCIAVVVKYSIVSIKFLIDDLCSQPNVFVFLGEGEQDMGFGIDEDHQNWVSVQFAGTFVEVFFMVYFTQATD